MSPSVKGFGCRPYDGVAAHTGPASESLQRRKPRWGDVGRRVKQPSDDQDDRLWGFDVWRHLYFQWLGYSKNTTPHNLNVSSSIFEGHEANRSLVAGKPPELSEPKLFRSARQEHHRICNSAYVEIPTRPTSATLHTIAIEGSSWLLCNGWCSATPSRSARPQSSNHRQLRANCPARHDELSPIASPCRQPRRSTARAV